MLHRIIPVQCRCSVSCKLGTLGRILHSLKRDAGAQKEALSRSLLMGLATAPVLEQRGTCHGKTPTLSCQRATKVWTLFWWHLLLCILTEMATVMTWANWPWSSHAHFWVEWLQKRTHGCESLLWRTNNRAFSCQKEIFLNPVLPQFCDDYKLPKVLNSAGNIYGNHQRICLSLKIKF